jgi:hypothetical protein
MMNRAIKTKIIGWFYVFFLVSVTQLHADGNNSPADRQSPQFEVLDKFRGNWKVTAIRRHPDPKTLTYDENVDWVLNGRFLRSETSQKSDGSRSMSMCWYDVNKEGYLYTFFDSTTEPTGFSAELPPATWDESKQSMEWDSGLLGILRFTGFSTFLNKDTVHTRGTLKDWKGSVLVDVEATSIRQK